MPSTVPPPEALASAVLDSLLEGCQVIGFDWRYLYVNDVVVQQARRPRAELLGHTMMECYPGIERTAMFAELERCMTARVRSRMENEFEFPDGTSGWFELLFLPVSVGACVLSLDVTQRKRAEAKLARIEEQLRQAQKMEAVGRVAGGMAHDFNNLLSVMISYTHLLLQDVTDEAVRADLSEIDAAAKRAAELTGQLLAFSRKQVVEARVLDLGPILLGMEKMLRRLVGPRVELSIVADAALGQVKADRGHFEQVVMNLAVNARDAMPDGGKLTIELGNVTLDDGYASEHYGVAPGSYVLLAVTDTGCGMDKALQARIFEPFFTTKERGKGTGLGLSTVFGIVQQSGGHIGVYSEPGRGTCFKIYLPRVSEEPRATPHEVALPARPGSETILLVEDDDQVRAVLRQILRRSGYRVIEAADASAALALCQAPEPPIHLLLTDVVLPHMNGPELAARVTALRPSVKVLLMSGYTDDTVVRHGVLDAATPFLQKPVTPAALTRKLRELLG